MFIYLSLLHSFLLKKQSLLQFKDRKDQRKPSSSIKISAKGGRWARVRKVAEVLGNFLFISIHAATYCPLVFSARKSIKARKMFLLSFAYRFAFPVCN